MFPVPALIEFGISTDLELYNVIVLWTRESRYLVFPVPALTKFGVFKDLKLYKVTVLWTRELGLSV